MVHSLRRISEGTKVVNLARKCEPVSRVKGERSSYGGSAIKYFGDLVHPINKAQLDNPWHLDETEEFAQAVSVFVYKPHVPRALQHLPAGEVEVAQAVQALVDKCQRGSKGRKQLTRMSSQEAVDAIWNPAAQEFVVPNRGYSEEPGSSSISSSSFPSIPLPNGSVEFAVPIVSTSQDAFEGDSD